MAAKILKGLPGGLKMPAVGLGTWQTFAGVIRNRTWLSGWSRDELALINTNVSSSITRGIFMAMEITHPAVLELTCKGIATALKMSLVVEDATSATEENDFENALNTALELGYRHIDTAPTYQNEHIIGKVLRESFDSGRLKREDLFITTALSPFANHPDKVEADIKQALRKLQLDHVDLYLIHAPILFLADEKTGWFRKNEKGQHLTGPTDHVAIWKKMEEQVDAGRVKSIGLSNFNIRQIDRILKNSRIKPAILQVELHLHLQQPELVDFCRKNDVTVMAFCPLGSPGFNKGMMDCGMRGKELPGILGDPVVAKVAKKHSKSPAQVAIRFLLEIGAAPIPKSVTAKRLKENMDVFDFGLDSEDMKALRALDEGEAARICDMTELPGVDGHPEFPF